MIPYSVAAHPNPMDRDAAPKFYASAQCDKVMNMEEFAKHIATHGCVYKRSDIRAVLTMAVDCLREMLLNGYKVELGDLGNFYVSLNSIGTATAKDFDPDDHIKSVNVNWERGVEFYAVNKNYPEEKPTHEGYSRKLQADLFIDDRNLGGLPDWGEIYRMLSGEVMAADSSLSGDSPTKGFFIDFLKRICR